MIRFKQYINKTSKDNLLIEGDLPKEYTNVNKWISDLGSSKSTEVYETMAIMTAFLGKDLSKKNVINWLNKYKEVSEIGKQEINNLYKNIENEEFIKGYIHFIGKNMINLAEVGKPINFIHKNIGSATTIRKGIVKDPKTYYDSIDPSLVELLHKQNTADTVLIYKKGTPDNIIKNMPNLNEMNVDKYLEEKGIINVPDKEGNIVSQIIQVSLKKEASDARIGKLTTFLNTFIGKQDISPSNENNNFKNYLDLYDERKKLFEFNVLNWMKKIGGKVYNSVKEMFGWVIEKITEIVQGVQNSINKTLNDIEKTPMSKSIEQIALSSQTYIQEGVIYEESKEPVELDESLKKNIIEFFKSVKKNNVGNMFTIMIKNINEINTNTKSKISVVNSIELIADNAIEKLESNKINSLEKNIKEYFDLQKGNKYKLPIKSKKKTTKGEIVPGIPRDSIREIFKVHTNFISYRTINSILDEIKRKSKNIKDIKSELLSFAVSAQSDAIFGNTLLPLWKVYGGEHTPEFLGQKVKYTEDKLEKLKENSDNVPICKIIISQIKGLLYNKVNMYLISGLTSDKPPNINYLFGEMTTGSGSAFSFKFELNTQTTKEKMEKAK